MWLTVLSREGHVVVWVGRLSIVASVAFIAILSSGGVAAGGQSWGLDTDFGR